MERFDRRGRESDDPWVRHHRRLIGLRGGPVVLGASDAGAAQETYGLLVGVLWESVS